jgi:hypothetical protein
MADQALNYMRFSPRRAAPQIWLQLLAIYFERSKR